MWPKLFYGPQFVDHLHKPGWHPWSLCRPSALWMRMWCFLWSRSIADRAILRIPCLTYDKSRLDYNFDHLQTWLSKQLCCFWNWTKSEIPFLIEHFLMILWVKLVKKARTARHIFWLDALFPLAPSLCPPDEHWHDFCWKRKKDGKTKNNQEGKKYSQMDY